MAIDVKIFNIEKNRLYISLACAQGTYQLEISSTQSRACVFLIDKHPAKKCLSM